MPRLYRRVIAIALLCHLQPVAAFAQSSDDYTALLDRYRDEPDDAVAALSNWPSRAISDAVDAFERSLDEPRRLAAVMLHSDVAARTIGGAPRQASSHVRVAARLLDRSRAGEAFAQRWYSFIVMVFLSGSRFDDAARTVEEGLSRHPAAAMLYAARATVAEFTVFFGHPHLREQPILDDRLRLRATRTLERAAADYREAIRLDPGYEIARVRLAWVHILLRDPRAERELSEVVRSAKDSAALYLAHLFRGGIAARNRRQIEARRDYEAARRAGPRYQAACIALSHLEAAAGDLAQGRRLALECVGLQHDDDPWGWMGSLTPDTPDWLRAEVQRR